MILRSLVTAWVQNAAKERLRETVQQAVREKLDPAAAGEAEPAAPRPCDVGIIFAEKSELGGMEDQLDGVLATAGGGFTARQGGLSGRNIVLLTSGAGSDAARRGAEALIAGHHPRWIVSAGFADGLQSQLNRGDLLLVDRVTDETGRAFGIDLSVDPAALAAAPGVHVGGLLSVEREPRTAAERTALAAAHPALAADRGSAAVAEVCSREKVLFLAVRIVHRAAADEPPREVERVANKKSMAGKLGAAVGALVKRPSSVKDMWQVKEDELLHSDRLAKFLSSVVAQLPKGRPDATEGQPAAGNST